MSNVAIGESGVPSVAVSIPEVLGDSVVEVFDPADLIDDDSGFGGDPGQDSGEPGDALFFSRSISKTAGSGQTSGTFTGLVRATDVAAALDRSDYYFPLDPSLIPLAGDLPEPVTYQSFEVFMGAPGNPPVAEFEIITPLGFDSCPVIVRAFNVNDTEMQSVTVEFDWLNDGTWTVAGTIDSPYPETQFTSPNYAATAPNNEMRTVPVRFP